MMQSQSVVPVVVGDDLSRKCALFLAMYARAA
jgi:hypothetical protein